jgi:hypothetical protein
MPSALDAVELLIGLSEARKTGETWRAPIQAIHEALYEARAKHPNVFASLHFSDNTLTPYSTSVESALASLGAARLVSVDNPDFRALSVKQQFRAVFREHLVDLDDEAQKALREAVGIFDTKIAEWDPNAGRP